MKNIFGIILSNWWDPWFVLPKIAVFVLFFSLSHCEFNEKLRNVTFSFAITALWLELGQVCSFFPLLSYNCKNSIMSLRDFSSSIHVFCLFCICLFFILLTLIGNMSLCSLSASNHTAAFSMLKVNQKFIPFFIFLYFFMYFFSPYVSPFFTFVFNKKMSKHTFMLQTLWFCRCLGCNNIK